MALQENLELDINEALRSVDRLEASLSQVAESFKVELADALSALNVSVDVSTITDDISTAVESADTTVVLEGDAEAVTAEIDALDGETVELEVDADTSQAQQEIDDLGESADDTTESTDGLGLSIGGLSAKSLAAAGGIAGLVASTTTLFTSGLDAASSLQSFDARLGDLAASVESVEVDGLNTTIGQLAQDLGSSDEAVRGSIARLVEFGDAAGATDSQLEATSDQVLLLAARAVSLNPELGDIGDVITQLQGGLSRGGRRLANFGVELTAVEIEARALADTGKLTNTELTEFDKLAAGAALAAEQLGTSLTGDINTESKNVALNFEQLKQIYGDTIEDLGKPLVVPVLDLLEAAMPIALDLFGVLADVAGDIVPILSDVFSILDELGAVEALGVVLGQFAEGLGLIVGAVDALLGALGPVAPAIGAIAAALILLNVNPIFAAITAIGVASTALKGLGQSLGIVGEDSRDLDPIIESLTDKVYGEVESIDDLAVALDNVTGGVEDFLRTSSESKILSDFSDELAQAGVTTEELAELMQQGGEGARLLGTRLADAGVDGADLDDGLVTLTGTAYDLIKAFGEEQDALDGASRETLNNLVLNGELTSSQLQALTTTNLLADGTVDYAGALEAAVTLTQESSDALSEQAPRLADSAQAWTDLAAGIIDGTVTTLDYAAAAERLGVDLITVETFADQVTAALDTFTAAAVSKLPDVSAALEGIEEATDPQQIIENLQEQTEAIANFQANLSFLAAFGSEFDAIQRLAIEQGPVFTNELIKGLREGGPGVAAELEASLEAFETQTAETSAFLTDTAVPALVDPAGVAAGAITEAYRDDLDFTGVTASEVTGAAGAIETEAPTVEVAAEGSAQTASQAWADAFDIVTGTETGVQDAGAAFGTVQGQLDSAADTSGAAAAAAFEGGADLEEAVRANVRAGALGFDVTSAILTPKALLSGKEVGEAFDQGIALGIVTGSAAVNRAARQVVDTAAAAARSAAGIQSPSRLFADEVGDPIAAGIAMGIDAGAQDVAASAERVIVAGAVAAGGVASTGALSGSGGGVEIGVVDVEVIVNGTMSESQARGAGQAIVAGMSDELERRQIRAMVRAQ